MTVIVCAGKNGEMLFNKRRCSRDRAVIADILSLFGAQGLCVSAYSAPLFEETVRVVSSVEEASDGVLFLEDFPLAPTLERAEKLVVYRFDRVYPANVRLTVPEEFTMTQCEEFSGFSHDKITREVYEK